MTEPTTNPVHKALYRILRPMARLLLRNGLTFHEMAELMRRAYVDVALSDFSPEGKKPTDSRAAVLTGLSRKEVKKQREFLESNQSMSVQAPAGRSSRVVSGWVRDAAFHDASGKPADLPFDGDLSFSQLVKRYSGDMTPRAVLEELLRVGVVAWTNTEHTDIRLMKQAFVPAGDDQELLNIASEDASDLLRTLDYNLSARGQAPMFQRTLSYTRIPTERLSAWRDHAGKESQALLEQLDQYLAPLDADVSGQDSTAQTARTGISIFYFEDPLPTERKETDDS
ncbi:MAG: DUF6502 family protein [Saccharospirillum sp.]